MFVEDLERTYTALRDIGLVNSKREFSRHILGRSDGYLSEMLARPDRQAAPRWVADAMLSRLTRICEATDAAGSSLDTILAQARSSADVARRYFRR